MSHVRRLGKPPRSFGRPSKSDPLCPDLIPGGSCGFKRVSEELPRYKDTGSLTDEGDLVLIAKDWPRNATVVAKKPERVEGTSRDVRVTTVGGKLVVTIGDPPPSPAPAVAKPVVAKPKPVRVTKRSARGTWDPTIDLV